MAGDNSCLMHVGGLLSGTGRVRTLHLAEILVATESPSSRARDIARDDPGGAAVSGTFVGMPAFPEAARGALADTQLRHNLAHATRTIRDKRAQVVAEVPEWEELRLTGAAIKESTLRDLERHLVDLEASLQARGAVVHWANDAAEANEIVARITKDHGADEVVKVKSMATAEIGLNEALAEHGIAAWRPTWPS